MVQLKGAGEPPSYLVPVYNHKTRLTCDLDIAVTPAVWGRLLAYAERERPSILLRRVADCQLVSMDLPVG